jgi:tetratricopeptide (TPR) repeat protein
MDGEEAHRIGAHAEAHQHYDQALALWDRVPDAELLAGMSRGKLGLRSALAAAASGDVPRAVHLLRRIRTLLAGQAELPGAVIDDDPSLLSRIGERLAYYLLQSENREWFAEALTVARDTVHETPHDPATWYLARAMATYAIALMVAHDDGEALDWARRAREVAGESGARSVEADALVTIGQLSNRAGNTDEAIGMFTAAFEQAAAARVLGVELRAAFNLAHEHLIRGELHDAARVAHAGVLRSEEEGLGLAPFGMDLQHLHFQAHYALGEWDHAQELADGFPVRVTSEPEAVLSAMALFLDVARDNAIVAERQTWLEPFWDISRSATSSAGCS